MKKNRGFSVMEVLIYMGIVAVFLAIAGVWQKHISNIRAIKETKERVAVLHEAIRREFLSNVNYAERNCYGWSDVGCSIITLFPVVVDVNTLQFNTYDVSVVNTLRKAGCIIQGDLPNFSVQCRDGFGQPLSFQDAFSQNFGTDYLDYYRGNKYLLTIRDSLNTRYVIDLNKELDWAYSRTIEKITEIGTAIKQYIRTRRIAELTNVCDTGTGINNPAGGLHSSDDALVVWVWQALGNSPFALCSGIEDTVSNCGCRDFDNNVWIMDSAYCVLDQPAEIRKFLTNLGLGDRYKTDGFGNKITIVPLADANGNAVNCPPPKPEPFYPVSGIPKTRIGIFNGTEWVHYIDVVGE